MTNLASFERQEQLLRLVEQQQRITVDEVCRAFSVSMATARRDLEALASRGKVQRVHGGALAVRQAPPEPPVLLRETEQADEKRRIGATAASLVKDGETVFVSSGTTTLEVARHLRGVHNLTVITNSLPVINTLAGLQDITVVSLGGLLRHSELSFIGHLTEQALAEVSTDKVFIGIHAIDIEKGLTNHYLPETMTDRAILHIGREVIVVADHTKCGQVSTALVAPITAMHTLVTDAGTTTEFIEALTAHGIRVVTA
ncbi:MAG TPA: DeoR/GlpR family DNA-binding transcription regulator [Aggregatilineales bacterium]|nr:DeoR/GlpR family DNA-binding transcription regulator [Aggregatilineales bacterium]